MYSQAATDPLVATARASKPKQSATLPLGTVAFLVAANTCHLLPSSGQAMKPVAPAPVKVQVPKGLPGVYLKGPVEEPAGM